jgi:RHS repeat-associated protein
MRRYYYAGAQRIAMRTSTDLKFLLGDHLGSTSVTAYASGAFDTETRYYPWGGARWASGTTPTDYRFTGQQEIVTIGLYFYNSRFYDAALGRFVSPDSIIPNPGDPVSFDRFAYVRNNPLRYIDPSGQLPENICLISSDDGNCVISSIDRARNIAFNTTGYPFMKSPEDTNTSQAGIEFIMQVEGLELQLYNDGNNPLTESENYYDTTGIGKGNCTIGYGYLIHAGPCNGDPTELPYVNGISELQARELLMMIVNASEEHIRSLVDVKLTQHMFDALVSLVYNWGDKNFAASAKLTMLNGGNYVGMAQDLLRGPITANGVISPGLVRRRELELRIFLTAPWLPFPNN